VLRNAPIVAIPRGSFGYYRLPAVNLGGDPGAMSRGVMLRGAAATMARGGEADEAEEKRWRRWERASTVLLVLTSAISLAASLGWFKPKG
jgi:hypothetical protein